MHTASGTTPVELREEPQQGSVKEGAKDEGFFARTAPRASTGSELIVVHHWKAHKPENVPLQ